MMRIAVGSYAGKEEEGIRIVVWDEEGKRLSPVSGVRGIERPSFLAMHPTRPFLFAVSETEHGEVVSYQYDEATGELVELSRQSTKGADPCHIQVDPSGRFILGTNYSSGSVFVHPVLEDGRIGQMSQLLTHTGKSVHEMRQTSPHPHSIWNIPNTSYWIVPDLGTDTLFIYTFDSGDGQLTLHQETSTVPGSGPRHVTFHPTEPVLYVVQELIPSVAVFSYDVASGVLNRMQTDVPILLPKVARESEIENTAADIHVADDGRQLFASNRGDDCLATFTLEHDGRVVPGSLITMPTTGRTPRNFAVLSSGLDGTHVLVANQDSDTIVIFGTEKDDFDRHQLRQVGHLFATVKPVCLAIIR